MAIRNPMDWATIYHRTTKNGADDLKFAKRVLADLTHYADDGAFSDDDARSLANALFAYHKCNVDLPVAEPKAAVLADKSEVKL